MKASLSLKLPHFFEPFLLPPSYGGPLLALGFLYWYGRAKMKPRCLLADKTAIIRKTLTASSTQRTSNRSKTWTTDEILSIRPALQDAGYTKRVGMAPPDREHGCAPPRFLPLFQR